MIIEGSVIGGKRIGRTIGFPTANICPVRTQGSGCDGVYAAWIFIDGRRLPCMLNIGTHPTLPDGPRTVEAHIFSFADDIYGCDVRVETVCYLRGEQKFADVAALTAQLRCDREQAQRILMEAAQAANEEMK